MKKLKNLFSGIEDEELPLEERHLREIEALQSVQREEKKEKKASEVRSPLAKRGFSVKLVSAAACAVAAVFACTLAFRGLFHKDGMETGRGSDSTLPPTNVASDGDLRTLLSEGYEQEALAVAAVRYMDEYARKDTPVNRAAAVTLSADFPEEGGQDSYFVAKANCVYFYPLKAVTFWGGFEFYAQSDADTFLTQKCGKGALRIIVVGFSSETVVDESLLCVVGEQGSYFSLGNGMSFQYLSEGETIRYPTGPQSMIHAEFSFSGHKKIANGMIIKDLEDKSEETRVTVKWTEQGRTLSVSTHDKRTVSGTEFLENDESGWAFDSSETDGAQPNSSDGFCHDYTAFSETYKQADAEEVFELSEFVAEYVVVRLTANVEIRDNFEDKEQLESAVQTTKEYRFSAVYGIYDKNGDYYEVPCKVILNSDTEWGEETIEALTEGSVWKVYISEMRDVYDDDGYYTEIDAQEIYSEK